MTERAKMTNATLGAVGEAWQSNGSYKASLSRLRCAARARKGPTRLDHARLRIEGASRGASMAGGGHLASSLVRQRDGWDEVLLVSRQPRAPPQDAREQPPDHHQTGSSYYTRKGPPPGFGASARPMSVGDATRPEDTTTKGQSCLQKGRKRTTRGARVGVGTGTHHDGVESRRFPRRHSSKAEFPI